MTFNLNHEAAYDAGLICGGTLEIFVEPILPQPRSTFSAAATCPPPSRAWRIKPDSPSAS